MNYNQNNLNLAKSPYLLQHQNNPVWWQEWKEDVLEYAKANNKLIFVSSGYSTCHWCHVMANDTFSNLECSKMLNNYFISIKIDREERPDIDHYLMSFMSEAYGNGGWPLNVIFTPDLKPFFAATYIGSNSRYGMPGFTETLSKVIEFYNENKHKLKVYNIYDYKSSSVNDDDLIQQIISNFDKEFGGFGYSMKFPPHNTLLYLIHYYEENPKYEIKEIIEKTLESIIKLGLNDHLKGGFFRYCVSQDWGIPHFEKMLYDQAGLIMVFSAAYKVFKHATYNIEIYRLLRFLENSFLDNDIFISAIDADTNHIEGETYLWQLDELNSALGGYKNEFSDYYDLIEYEDKYHLIRKSYEINDEINNILLSYRDKKEQPFKDTKKLISWNSLLGIGFIYAYRATNDSIFLNYAIKIYKRIKELIEINGKLIHSVLDDNYSDYALLEDYASFLLFNTYLIEDYEIDNNLFNELIDKVKSYYNNGKWYESLNTEIGNIPAKEYDHPTPSSVSMAEMALIRSAILSKNEYDELKNKEPINFDYHNLAAFLSHGYFNEIYSTEKINWSKLPLNTIQIIDTNYKACYKGSCRFYSSHEELMQGNKNIIK